MKKIFVFAFVFLSVSLVYAQKKETSTYRESSARNIEPRQGMIVVPLVADLQVISEDRIKPYEEVFPYVVTPAIVDLVPAFKKTAFLNAARANNADAIVGSSVDVNTTGEGYLKITISGYPAKYTNFRNATKDDVWMTQLYQIIDNSHNNDIFLKPEQFKINIEKENK